MYSESIADKQSTRANLNTSKKSLTHAVSVQAYPLKLIQICPD